MIPLKLAILTTLVLGFAIAHPAATQEGAGSPVSVDTLLETGTDIIGQPIAYPAGTPNVTAAVVTLAQGAKTGWHTHEVPMFGHVLEGEVTVDYGGEGVRVYAAGDSLVEAVNWPHNGVNTGDGPVRILVVYMGSNRRTNAAPAPAPD